MTNQEEKKLALLLVTQLPDDAAERDRVLGHMHVFSDWLADGPLVSHCELRGQVHEVVELRRDGVCGGASARPRSRASCTESPPLLPK